MDAFITKLNTQIINPLIILFFAVALLVFVWGLVGFVGKAGDADALETAKKHVVYGLIGMFIMVSAFSIIRIVLNTFGIDSSKIDSIEK